MLPNNLKKIVIKLGSTTVVDRKGNFKKDWVNSLVKDLKNLKKPKGNKFNLFCSRNFLPFFNNKRIVHTYAINLINT